MFLILSILGVQPWWPLLSGQLATVTKGVWKFLSTVCQTDTGIKLAELEHSSLKKCIPFCSGRVPILVHPSLYRSLKLRFPIDVGGITRDNRVTTELGTGSLRQAVGILTPKDFRPVVDTDSEIDGFKRCQFECEGTEGFKQVRALAWWTQEPRSGCCCSAGDPLHLRCRLSGAGKRL